MSSEKGDIEKNLESTKKYFKQAIDGGADIVVFPEMSLTGYFISEEYLNKALTLKSKEVLDIVNLTKDNNFTIIFGIAEKYDDKLFVSQLVAQNGYLVGVYRKHNVINNETKIFTSGEDLPTFNLGEHKFGITICADIDLPELFEKYTQLGCSLVFECASPDLYGDRVNRDWLKGYNWWRNNCIEKIGRYSKNNNIKVAVTTQSGRNIEDDFPGGGYLFSQNGDLVSETSDYEQNILIVEI